MKRFVKIEDATRSLTESDKVRLSSFIPDKCLCNQEILDQLIKIRIVDYGNIGWEGKWDEVKRILSDGTEEFIGGQIILNIHYAREEQKYLKIDLLERLEETLCHEYGHHWTLCWAAEYIENPLENRYLLPYYRARNLDLKSLLCFYEEGEPYDVYLHCDKEVVAEDFKVLFTPCNKHMMANIPGIGIPNRRVRYFLSRMVAPNYI